MPKATLFVGSVSQFQPEVGNSIYLLADDLSQTGPSVKDVWSHTYSQIDSYTGPGEHPCNHVKIEGMTRELIVPPDVSGRGSFQMVYSEGHVNPNGSLWHIYTSWGDAAFHETYFHSRWDPTVISGSTQDKISQIRSSLPRWQDWLEYGFTYNPVSSAARKQIHRVIQALDPHDDPYPNEVGWTTGGVWWYVTRSQSDLWQASPLIVNSDVASSILRAAADCGSVPPAGLQSEVFREATNMATLDTNSIANVLDIVQLLRDIKGLKLGKLVRDFKDLSLLKKGSKAWLSYRYQYCTTMSDIEEIMTGHEQALQAMDGNWSQTCRAAHSVNGGIMRCKIRMTNVVQNELCELYKHLKRLGFAPDLYNLWDLVPLSFVVDWFLPIGSFLEDYSHNWASSPGYFTFDDICMSWKWTGMVPYWGTEYLVTVYNRWLLDDPPPFEFYEEDPHTGTVIKRIFDGAALLLG